MSIRKIDGMTVRTNYEFPPIPSRKFDWSAVCDDTYDGDGSLIGWGHTEQEAIEDLLAELEARKSTPSERLAVAASETKSFDMVRDYQAMKEALQLTAAALQCTSRTLPNREEHTIRFTGEWSRFGSMSIGQILDRANQALEG